jgi:cytochrome P450
MGDIPNAAIGPCGAPDRGCNSAPVSLRQFYVLARAMVRAGTWAWPTASRELAYWRGRAESIPETSVREGALRSIVQKRDNALGAALFCVLPARREQHLLTLLVAYQTLWDFLDNLSEHTASLDTENGYQLHNALIAALSPDTTASEYDAAGFWRQGGGYLDELVATCQRCCRCLPSYAHVQSFVRDGVRQCALQDVNHLSNEQARVHGLKTWATQIGPLHEQLSWFEAAAASSAFLPHPLLALAAEPDCETSQASKVSEAYFPWMALAITMLDSYTDLAHDENTGDHSYISYYDTKGIASERLCEIVRTLMLGMAKLPNRDRHVLMSASMVAMYLSAEAHGQSPQSARIARRIAASGGSLTQLLVPIAQLWRRANGGQPPTPTYRADPLPPQLPMPSSVQTALFWHTPFTYLSHCRRRYGSRFTLNPTSHSPLVFLSDPQDIRTLIAAPEHVLRAGEGGATVSPIVGERSFMLSDGEPHRNGRKAVMAALHARAIAQHAGVVADAAQRALASWPTDRTVAVHDRLRDLTLEVLLRALTGQSEGPLDGQTQLLHRTVLDMLTVTQSPTFVEPRLRHGPGKRVWQRFLHRRAQVDELLAALVTDHQPAPDATNDLLARLAAIPADDSAQSMRRRLRDNTMSLILAGHETTAAQLAWAFQLLAHHPSVCDRLIREIDADRKDEYLTATVQEVLRHRCVFVFAIPRVVAKPVEIGTWTYAPQANLLACIYLLHHDPAIYPDPHAFRPERFLDTPPDPLTWIPWGGGRKRCPGLHLAMLEMKVVLRTVLRERTPRASARQMERPRWRSVIVAPHAGSQVVLASRR